MQLDKRTKRPAPSEGILPPIEIDAASEVVEFWSGEAKLESTEKISSGIARIFAELLPRPTIGFEIKTDDDTSGWEEMVRTITGQGSRLGLAKLHAARPFGDMDVDVRRVHGGTLSGAVEPNSLADESITSAKLLVINGPYVRGEAIVRGQAGFCGRLHAKLSGATVTVDQLHADKPSRRSAFAFTHVAEIRFETPQPATALESIQTTLFRSLSLINGRWVGLLGPWLFDDAGLVQVSAAVTKTSRHGGNFSWYPDTVLGVFDELLPRLHEAYSDPQRGEAIQTGFHWLVESSLCAGAVEGSLILQQAALESLAWYEIVQHRQLCSTSGFEKLPASDKIRWFASLYSISTDIPAHCNEISSYGREYGLRDFLEVLADVRNALIHGTPKKVERLLGRVRGADERTELWHQIGGILDQAVLAVVGYNGKMIRRDVDVQWKTSAIRPVPCAPAAQENPSQPAGSVHTTDSEHDAKSD